MKKKLKLELALVAMLGFSTIAQASLIENGSFEIGINPPSGGYRTLSATNTNISGWTVCPAIYRENMGANKAHPSLSSSDLIGGA